jgi:hypothetical protein
MTATRKTSAPKARRRAATTPTQAAAAPPGANIDTARNLFNASLAPMHGALRFMAQWRETQAGLLHEMDRALESTLREAESAADVQELMRLHSELASHNLNRATNAAGALFRSWLETEAALLEQAQRGGADATRQLIQGAQATATGNGHPADSNPAADMFQQAQAAWTQAAQQWIATVRNGATR